MNLWVLGVLWVLVNFRVLGIPRYLLGFGWFLVFWRFFGVLRVFGKMFGVGIIRFSLVFADFCVVLGF